MKRDTLSNAVVETNKNEYDMRVLVRKKAETESSRYRRLLDEIDNLKKRITVLETKHADSINKV